ncbi:MAG: metallophosphoesterase [Infirmifilum sp.]|uniref:metallophosphoesterase n=1 Tax=Infirmifilum TaxID=2856573 RepID=UPI00235220E7
MSTSKSFEDFLKELRPLRRDSLIELLDDVTTILKSEEQLIKIEAPRILFVGDTHGDVESSIKALKSDASVKVFLGDYVDRGKFQIENIELLLLAKREYPDKVFLLRGNHESREMNEVYGFLREMLNYYDYEVYELMLKVFSNMSVAATVNNEIFAVHGGIAKGLYSANQIENLPKSEHNIDDEIIFQMLWNDPSEEVEDFAPSPRGWGIYLYGRKPVESFLEESGLKFIVRAHEPFPEGYKIFFDGKLISIFSCRFYPIENPRALLVENKKREIQDLV